MRSYHTQLAIARTLLATLLACACLIPSRPARALDDPYLSEAQAAIVCDQTGKVLWGKNEDMELPLASITKIMTAVVALDEGLDLDATCTITETDLPEGAQLVNFKATDKPTMRELMQAMLIYSGNDAAINVATNVFGSEQACVARMNQKAQQLGMTHTHFANTHGLEEPGHYSSVRDLVLLGRYALMNYPFIGETVQKRGVEVIADGTEVYLESTDELMETYEGLLGIKTGSVVAGTTFLGASKRGSVALFTAVLGCETEEGRFEDTASLMDWAYDTFSQRVFGREGWVIATAPYALGFAAHTKVTLGSDQRPAVWPTGGDISYRSVVSTPCQALTPGEPYSAIWWRQDGRYAGASACTVDLELSQSPSVNIFSRPLFVTKVSTDVEEQ